MSKSEKKYLSGEKTGESMGIETELKFTVNDRGIFDRIKSLGKIAGLQTVRKGLQKITDTYFDTYDRMLLNGKAVFRLRLVENKSLLAFKSHKISTGSAYQRIEIESETNASVSDITSGNMPDIPPVRALLKKFGTVPLFTSLKTENNRDVILLARNNTPLYELVLDDVTFTGPGGKATVYELEVESLSDRHDGLETIGEWLTERFDLQLAGPSKYILGMGLVGNVGI